MSSPEGFLLGASARPMGIECEYDVQIRKNAHILVDDPQTGHQRRQYYSVETFLRPGVLEIAGLITVSDKHPTPSPHRWLANGSLLYPDLGFLEYSTFEALGPRDAAAADAAGMIIVDKLVKAAMGAGYKHNGVYRRTGLITPGEDPDSYIITTSGYHQNFLIPAELLRHGNFYERAISLIDNLVTRAWGWCGAIGPEGFEWSQKFRGIGLAISTDMDTRQKEGGNPAVLLRGANINNDNDVNPMSEWLRLEVRLADPSISRCAGYLALAVTSMMLRLIEHWNEFGSELQALRLKNPLQSLHALALSPMLNPRPLELIKDNATIHADELQLEHLGLLTKFAERYDLPPDELAALPLLEEACVGMHEIRENRDTEPLAEISDNARKHGHLSRLRERPKSFGDGRFTVHNPKAVQHDRYYDRTDTCTPNGRPGAGLQLAASGRFRPKDEQYVPSTLVEQAVRGPLPGTRAVGRAAFVRAHAEARGTPPDRIDWSGAIGTDNSGQPYTQLWPSPFDPTPQTEDKHSWTRKAT